jgi:hypothetical protein
MRTTMTRTIPVLAAVFLLAGGLAACRGGGGGTAAKTEASKTRYHCPMHPAYVSDRPGQCPICKMDLVPTQAAAGAGGERKILYYRSPMDPSIRSEVPQKDAMGMDFVPVYEDEACGSSPTHYELPLARLGEPSGTA